MIFDQHDAGALAGDDSPIAHRSPFRTIRPRARRLRDDLIPATTRTVPMVYAKRRRP
jgi:hypothetical protein